jgi:dihydrofolate reductase
MGKLVVSENVTLDMVVQDPTGEEGSPHGGWYTRITAADRNAFAEYFAAEAEVTSALLMGRRSYEWFAERWLDRTGPWADRLAALPKYVVSSKLTDPAWANTTVVGPDDVAGLKERVDGDLVVYGSNVLVQTLLGQGLVDELRLLVYPYAVGVGDRLVGPATGRYPLRLTGNRTVGEGFVALTYEVVATE